MYPRKSYQEEVGVYNRKKLTFAYQFDYCLFWSSIPTTKFEEEILTKQSFNWERCLRVSAILEVWINLDFSQENKPLNVTNVTGVLGINQISSDIQWHIQGRRHLHVVSLISALVQLCFFKRVHSREKIYSCSQYDKCFTYRGTLTMKESIPERGLLHAATVARVLV